MTGRRTPRVNAPVDVLKLESRREATRRSQSLTVTGDGPSRMEQDDTERQQRTLHDQT